MTHQSITNNIKAPKKSFDVLKKNFSHCFDKDGKFDFNRFKEELSESQDIDFSSESYGIDWLGKSYSRLLASDEATTLLKEDKKWNQREVNKDSENLLIKGDNLEVLKHLSNAYYGKIKMIYIDPPYNTGTDGFVYEDDRKFNVEELSRLAGVDEEKAKRILDFIQSKSNSHSAWLTFMYPRLYIAKQLLREDGVIFISIDDNEVAQLRLMMDEIFGEENYLNTFCWVNNLKGRQISGVGAARTYENIVVYGKTVEHITLFQESVENLKALMPNSYKGFNYKVESDTSGDFVTKNELFNTNSSFNEETRPNLVFNIHYNFKTRKIKFSDIHEELEYPGFVKILPKRNNNGVHLFHAWRWSKDKILSDKHNLKFVETKGGVRIYTKVRSHDVANVKDIITDITTTKGASRLKELFNNNLYFPYPKATELINLLISSACRTNKEKTDIILDFFAGSGTTADAVMRLNAEDGGNRKYILVQLPELIDSKKNKIAYDFVKNELGVDEPTIFEITKERLIRAAEKIKEDNKSSKESKDLSHMDFGFKIFETIPIWEDYHLEAEMFDPQVKLFDEKKLTKEDLEILLSTWKTYDGFALTQGLNKIDLDGYTGYYIESKLYLIEKGFRTKHLKKVLEEIDSNEELNPSAIVVFGYNFDSKMLREIADNVKNYSNRKQIDIDFITRY